jgi:hypothetical protein
MTSLTRLLVPAPGAGDIHAYGRTFSASAGAATLGQYDDAASVLASNNWSMLPLMGTTVQRPTVAGPNNGDVYIDTTLSKVVFALFYPQGSGKVVGWCDMNGNAA